ncbi:MAG TPA: hypothetical protein VD927_10270, partial [Chryseosolibacter sp.]|nr:hypothetical protein [Chryseosolibacter sp.]
VGSFDKVLASCKQIGERYQPTATQLSITAMSELLQRSHQAMKAVTTTQSASRLAIIARRETFAGLPTLSMRVVRMLATLDLSPDTLEAVNSLKQQLQGGRPAKKTSAEGSEGSTDVKRAAIRRHFGAQLQTFGDLVQIIADIGNYNPKETDLKLSALKAKVADLQSKSHAVVETKAALQNARKLQKQLLYGTNGVTQTIKGAKNYVCSVFGVKSPELSEMTKRN